MNIPELSRLIEHYYIAREWVSISCYAAELDWQNSASIDSVTETEFLREYAWVVLCSGFRESIVRDRFDYISLCFCDWESSSEIALAGNICVSSASSAFRNKKKLDAILNVAREFDRSGFRLFRQNLLIAPLEVISTLPFMGPITSFHLAKNIGVDVAKPDRHLIKVAREYGYSDVRQMCSEVATLAGDRSAAVDVVLWRFEERVAASMRGSTIT